MSRIDGQQEPSFIAIKPPRFDAEPIAKVALPIIALLAAVGMAALTGYLGGSPATVVVIGLGTLGLVGLGGLSLIEKACALARESQHVLQRQNFLKNLENIKARLQTAVTSGVASDDELSHIDRDITSLIGARKRLAPLSTAAPALQQSWNEACQTVETCKWALEVVSKQRELQGSTTPTLENLMRAWSGWNKLITNRPSADALSTLGPSADTQLQACIYSYSAEIIKRVNDEFIKNLDNIKARLQKSLEPNFVSSQVLGDIDRDITCLMEASKRLAPLSTAAPALQQSWNEACQTVETCKWALAVARKLRELQYSGSLTLDALMHARSEWNELITNRPSAEALSTLGPSADTQIQACIASYAAGMTKWVNGEFIAILSKIHALSLADADLSSKISEIENRIVALKRHDLASFTSAYPKLKLRLDEQLLQWKQVERMIKPQSEVPSVTTTSSLVGPYSISPQGALEAICQRECFRLSHEIYTWSDRVRDNFSPELIDSPTDGIEGRIQSLDGIKGKTSQTPPLLERGGPFEKAKTLWKLKQGVIEARRELLKLQQTTSPNPQAWGVWQGKISAMQKEMSEITVSLQDPISLIATYRALRDNLLVMQIEQELSLPSTQPISGEEDFIRRCDENRFFNDPSSQSLWNTLSEAERRIIFAKWEFYNQDIKSAEQDLDPLVSKARWAQMDHTLLGDRLALLPDWPTNPQVRCFVEAHQSKILQDLAVIQADTMEDVRRLMPLPQDPKLADELMHWYGNLRALIRSEPEDTQGEWLACIGQHIVYDLPKPSPVNPRAINYGAVQALPKLLDLMLRLSLERYSGEGQADPDYMWWMQHPGPQEHNDGVKAIHTDLGRMSYQVGSESITQTSIYYENKQVKDLDLKQPEEIADFTSYLTRTFVGIPHDLVPRLHQGLAGLSQLAQGLNRVMSMVSCQQKLPSIAYDSTTKTLTVAVVQDLSPLGNESLGEKVAHSVVVKFSDELITTVYKVGITPPERVLEATSQ